MKNTLAGGIKKKQSFGIIHREEDKEPVRYCPNCTSILQKWILDKEQNYKPIKNPNTLFCLSCGETVKIYHPSSLT